MTVALVTGGAGFIGSHIVDALLERQFQVKVLDNLETGHRDNLAHVADRVKIYEGNVQDAEICAAAMKDVDFVFHQAALASVPRSVEDPLGTNAACVTGTLTVLNEARQAGVKRVMYAASSSAYGDRPTASNREEDAPGPLSPYGAAKLAGEHYCRAFYETYGLETVCLRYFNVFGPRQDPDSPYSAVIPLFITAILSGGKPTIYGDGLQSRDFTFVKNVVHGNMLAMEAPGAGGKMMNMANGKSISLLTLLEELASLLGEKVEPVHEPGRAGDVRDSMADISLARKILGYEPQIHLEEGLRKSIEYYRELVASKIA